MMILVIGGSGSGKSAYAEELACALAGKEHTRKYYLATMQVFDEESRRKVERHRTLRDGKGFQTIEQPVRIEDALLKMGDGRKTVLLECVSNLTANEMFAQGQQKPEREVAQNVIKGIERLRKETTHLIVVGNNVFEDGIAYDETTTAYIRAMGAIHQKLAERAEQVVEMVVGLPVSVKA